MHGGASTGPPHPKAWHGLGEQIGNTVCIPCKRRRRGSCCADYSRTGTICSGGSYLCEIRGAWGSLLVFAITPSAVGRDRCAPTRNRVADSIKRDFGHDPLLHRSGRRMKWVRRLPPKNQGRSDKLTTTVAPE